MYVLNYALKKEAYVYTLKACVIYIVMDILYTTEKKGMKGLGTDDLLHLNTGEDSDCNMCIISQQRVPSVTLGKSCSCNSNSCYIIFLSSFFVDLTFVFHGKETAKQ